MFEIIYMKADFEPWWMFDGWEKSVVTRHPFHLEEEAKDFLKITLSNLRKAHQYEQQKNECFFAFWSDDEKYFCEACDEDAQIFHGIIILYDGKPFIL